jgi:hypothetical protein
MAPSVCKYQVLSRSLLLVVSPTHPTRAPLRPSHHPTDLSGHLISHTPSLPHLCQSSSGLTHTHTLDAVTSYTMATSQPIALPATTSQSPDVQMATGSFVAGTTFNPASYTRHFLGSPASWRAGSFGNRFYPGASPMAQYE